MKHHLHIPDADIISINSLNRSSNATTKELNRFHINLESGTPPEEQETARFILATNSAITTGLTLAEAISVGFLEPDFNAHTMAQGYARHCRQGNKNKAGVYSWLFTAKGNKTEERIQEVNHMKAKISEVQTRKVEIAPLDK